MKTSIVLAILLPFLGGLTTRAPTSAPADDSKPSTLNIPGQQYPRIDSDLHCTFRLKAPDAQKVRLHLNKDYDKEKNVPHIWHVDGNAHDTPEWKNNLHLFSQRLFR